MIITSDSIELTEADLKRLHIKWIPKHVDTAQELEDAQERTVRVGHVVRSQDRTMEHARSLAQGHPDLGVNELWLGPVRG